ncbi:sporulation protein SsgA [Kitasatospora sp. NE20-6]
MHAGRDPGQAVADRYGPPRETNVIIAQSGAASIPAPVPGVVPMVLRYDSDDPYAVVLEFPDPAADEPGGGDAPVRWRVSRDLLLDGLAGPAGAGDIRLAPRDGRYTEVEFHNRNGSALVQVETTELRAFLGATADAVRPGEEQVALPDTLEDFLRMTGA